MVDQPKLERCIGRLNDYWGGKMLSQITAAECRTYVKQRGKVGGARADLETLRAAINHHAKIYTTALSKSHCRPKGHHEIVGSRAARPQS